MTRARRKQLEAIRPKTKPQPVPEQEAGIPIPDGIVEALKIKSRLQKEITEKFRIPAIVNLDVRDGEWILVLRTKYKPSFNNYLGYKVFWLPAHAIAQEGQAN